MIYSTENDYEIDIILNNEYIKKVMVMENWVENGKM